MRTQTAKPGLTPVTAAGRDVMRAIVQDVYGSADRHQPRLIRRIRRCAPGQTGPQARRAELRAGRRRGGLRARRPASLRAGRIKAGQKVLIISASGGVGSCAVQLAKAFGATVTRVASTAKAGLVRSIGADEVIDYTREDFADGRQHYDLILDIGGNSRLSRLRRALTPGGRSLSLAAKAASGPESGGRSVRSCSRQWCPSG